MDCIFCKIVAGTIPAKKIYDTATVFAVHDISPKAKVHVLVMPKLHIVNYSDISVDNKSILGEMGIAVHQVVQDLGIAESGYKVICNNGRDGGQAVLHMHWHVLGGEKIAGLT